MDIALANGKVSNRLIASRLGVTETTIRRWRNENKEFDAVFKNAMSLFRERLNKTARENLEYWEKKIVINDGEKLKTITERLRPTHNDISMYSKVGVIGQDVTEKIEERTLLRETMKRKIAGELTALEAAQLLESEGIAVPKTLMLEVQKAIGIVDSGISQPTIIQFVPPGEGDAEHNGQN